MKMIDESSFLWVEKYRPQCLDDMILVDDKRKMFKRYIEQGEIQNILLSGIPGTGKTVTAKVLCNELGITPLFVNSSEESGVDVLRTKIKEFASTTSIGSSSKHKVVLLDEFDYSSAHFQAAARNLIESFASNCRFILTCNYKNKIIGAISESRMVDIEFTKQEFTSPVILKQLYDRLVFILKNENVPFEKEVVRELLVRFAPDLRRVVNQLQRYAQQNGSIDTGLLSSDSSGSLARTIDLTSLVDALRKKSFKQMRRWVIETGTTNDVQTIFRELYDTMYDTLEPQSIPQMVLLIAEYSYKSAFVIDQEILLTAMLTEVMSQCQIKKS